MVDLSLPLTLLVLVAAQQTTWAIRDVEQRLKDTQLMIGGLRKVLQNSDRQLHSMRQRVHVMEGR